jgi:hypothetical protein
VTAVLTVLGIIVAIGWLPVFWHFWKSWKVRNNPISLAICGLVGFMMYINVAVYIFIQNDPRWTLSVVGGVNVVVLLNFYACLRWAHKLFPEIKVNERLTNEDSRARRNTNR